MNVKQLLTWRLFWIVVATITISRLTVALIYLVNTSWYQAMMDDNLHHIYLAVPLLLGGYLFKKYWRQLLAVALGFFIDELCVVYCFIFRYDCTYWSLHALTMTAIGIGVLALVTYLNQERK